MQVKGSKTYKQNQNNGGGRMKANKALLIELFFVFVVTALALRAWSFVHSDVGRWVLYALTVAFSGIFVCIELEENKKGE